MGWCCLGEVTVGVGATDMMELDGCGNGVDDSGSCLGVGCVVSLLVVEVLVSVSVKGVCVCVCWVTFVVDVGALLWLVMGEHPYYTLFRVCYPVSRGDR